MDKKNNMKQAMYEMFGVGTAPAANTVTSAQNVQSSAPAPRFIPEENDKARTQLEKKVPDKTSVVRREPQPNTFASYLAPGTVMEGTLRCVGDVEIAGNFKGDITTKGTVILHANMQGNLSVRNLDLSGCKLVGDVVAGDVVTVGKDSEICGNVTAKELQCAGQITGDLEISEHTELDETARVNGNIKTGTMSVARGAAIMGRIETKMTKMPDKAAKTMQLGSK